LVFKINTLGINFGSHDTSACILQNGEVIVAIEEEKMNREKRTEQFPINAIISCLEIADLSLNDIDIVSLPIDLGAYLTRAHKILRLEDQSEVLDQINYLLDVVKEIILIPKKLNFSKINTKPKIVYFSHHLSHAASAYYSSGFSKSAVLVIDGVGELDTISIYHAIQGKLKRKAFRTFPHSLGKLYSSVCRYLGFSGPTKEGKVMALASFGSPIYINEFSKMIILPKKGLPKVNQSYFNFGLTPLSPSKVSKKFIDVFGKLRRKNDPIGERHKNIAASLQKLYEKTLIRIVKEAQLLTNENNICLAGGTMLNCIGNSRIRTSGIFDNIYIHPAPNDAGLSLGAAYLAYYENITEFFPLKLDNVYLGPKYSEEDIMSAAPFYPIKWKRIENPSKCAAKLISDGIIVGWFTGRLEWGPRALGNRSILADPRYLNLKEKINLLIKHRENFRPFSPSVLVEKAYEIFGCDKESPYMIDAFDINPKWKTRIPAVLHIDSTSRIQTVSRKDNPKYYDLIAEFFKLTEVPLVLNTSLNIRGEPIVTTINDALNTFIKSKLTHIFIENFLFHKE